MSGAAWRWLALRWAALLLVLLLIWWPEWQHFRIDRSVSPAMVVSFDATADSGLLGKLGDIDLAETRMLGMTPLDALTAAQGAGLPIPGPDPGRFRPSGYPGDLMGLPPSATLFMAGLGYERLLLDAWRQTGQQSLLELALLRLTQFNSYESQRHHDRGFLWNDHAVASRASVLIKAWQAMQRHPELQADHRPTLMQLVASTGQLLAKPGLFTVRTNHGVMQNIALLQLTAAFPALPQAGAWRAEADKRLALQLTFYVSEEGVVLEHSPGYHLMGTQLLAWARWVREANGLPSLPMLDSAGAAATKVLAALQRPDGSLPAIGNTDGHLRHQTSETAPSAAKDQLWPIAGWGIWQQATSAGTANAQLMFTWAYHPGHGHKHADEGAFVWWQTGQTWVTGVGYWPYGDARARNSYGWHGSNAPHGLREDGRSARQARLVGHATDAGIKVADIERQRSDGAVVRRTLIQLEDHVVLALDSAQKLSDGMRTAWTFGPNATLQAGADTRQWTVRIPGQSEHLQIALWAPVALQTQELRASAESSMGWTTVNGVPSPADTLLVSSVGDEALQLAALRLSSTAQPLGVQLQGQFEATRWVLLVNDGNRVFTLERDGQVLSVQVAEPDSPTAASGPKRLRLSTASVDAQTAALRNDYQKAVRQYPPWRDLWDYRIKITKVALGLALALEIAAWLLVWGLAHTGRGGWCDRQGARLGLALALVWAPAAAWLHFSYLRA
jgi:Heparinase II/III N-terminus/Heparinase II/III-like protein